MNAKIGLLLVAGCLLAVAPGCGHSAQNHARNHSEKRVHYDPKTGRYYYVVREKQNDGGDSWFYYWLTTGNNSGSDYFTTPTFTTLDRNTLASGAWVRGNPPDIYATRPPTPQELDNPQAQTEAVEVEQANTQENLGIPDENSLDSMEGVPESGETASNDGSSDSMSDSGDTGGDSGGDGGGDGGGGGDGD
jgi:uncharacterized membrane protein YgcG